MLERFITRIGSVKNFALAVSGGADSICMTLLCYQMGLLPEVLIVDHKLRDESSSEALYVKEYIENQFNFKVKILFWNRDKTLIGNIQSKARDARYRLLTSECNELGIETICTAHNKDDQAETVVLNIMRGTGIDGLVGIRETLNLNGINIIRPMLDFSREEIECYLKLHRISWVDDPSNDNDKYERVKIRKLMRVINDSNLVNRKHLISRLNLLSENIRSAQSFINNYVEKKIEEVCQFSDINLVTIDLKSLMCEDMEVVVRILRKLLKKVNEECNYLRGESIIRLYKRLVERNNKFCMTLGGCIMSTRVKNNIELLVITKENVEKLHKKIKMHLKSYN